MKDSWLGLADKVVIVTGGVGGMGTRFCADFAQQGAKVVVCDLNGDKATQYAQELQTKYGVETLGVSCNTTKEVDVDAAVASVIEKFGRIDILVNTAAILKFSPLEDLGFDEWKQTVDVNLNGYFLMSQRVGQVMIKQNKGSMVHVSTIASRFPETYSGAYSTTKAGVNMMSRQMAAEWGQFGIKSNCVLPCFVKTPLSAPFYADPEVEQGRKRLTASKRIGDLSDISNAVLFLASDRSDYTNGGEVTVEGGFGIMMGDMTPKPGGRRQYAIEHHQK
ncbi:SDR family oxidoreductase [Ligilactobacillus sp. Marseille-Q7487]|jgi:NAD(P)-dependent dehydrogenase (short-subunit alcohol dehydrogenase family)|uniref:SDR family NAD(P)-dependent oxidoreductase n=1 Tax=Ligilactobacillus sp. Marseille-Q7487 TaxID=3022128 RepID=UPI0015B63553|nr:SDR family oxidoreductase [Ligilactobacillus sp. Marseille-Q7487]